MKNLTLIIFSFCFSLGQAFGAGEPSPQEVEGVLSHVLSHSHSDRAIEVSYQFLGRPYVLGSCGEGDYGHYDPQPLTRFDQFDCTTFVEAVLGLAFTPSSNGSYNLKLGKFSQSDLFFAHLKNIKYSDPLAIRYTNRNHFTETNWVPNAEKKLYLRDVTDQIFLNSPVRKKTLDIKGWYQEKISALQASQDPDKAIKLEELLSPGSSKDESKPAMLKYIPLKYLLDKQVRQKLASYKILVFNLVKGEHTTANPQTIVGHQGFIVFKDNRLWVRHASSSPGVMKTVDVPFEEYIKKRMTDLTWPTLGMNFLQIQE